MMFRFLRKLILSDQGKLGNATRREREKAVFRAKTDEMRARMGLPAWEWAE